MRQLHQPGKSADPKFCEGLSITLAIHEKRKKPGI